MLKKAQVLHQWSFQQIAIFLILILIGGLSFLVFTFSPKSQAAVTLLGFQDEGTYDCNVGIRGWACQVGSDAPVKVGFYADGAYNPQDNAGSLSRYIGETLAGKSEGDDAAIDALCQNKGFHRFILPIPDKYRDKTKHTVFGYIDIGDTSIHPLGQQGGNFTCTLAAPTASCEPSAGTAAPICEGTHGVDSCPATMVDNSVSVVNFVWKGCSTSTYDLQQVVNGITGGVIKVKGTAFKSPSVDCELNPNNNNQPQSEGFSLSAQGIAQSLVVKLDGSTGAGISIPFTPNKCPGGNTNTTNHTLLNITLQLPGIGQGGNLSPKHQIRPLHVTIYPADTDLKTNPTTPATFDSDKSPTSQSITFSSTNGFFANDHFDVGTLPTGDYEVFMKTPGYLRKSVLNTTDQTTTIHITGATTNLIPLTKLIAGDIAIGISSVATDVQGLSNVIDLSDFYQIVGCYKDKATTSTCIHKDLADLNDDGTVDGIDINYWLLGFQTAQTTLTQPSIEVPGDGVAGD